MNPWEIDILMLTYNDHSNTGYRFAQCLRWLGYNVVQFKAIHHPFEYPAQAPIARCLANVHIMARYPVTIIGDDLGWYADRAKVIHFTGSTIVSKMGPDLKNKKVVVQHGGRTYRDKPNLVNQEFNPIADATIIQCPDLLRLGARNETLIHYPVDTDFIKPHWNDTTGRKVRIGHFPSSPVAKGTDKVFAAIERLSIDYADKYEYVGVHHDIPRITPWLRQLEHIAGCDILIESISPEVNGNKCGEWGNTALEGAALGKVVVTNFTHSVDYEAAYGTTPAIIRANDEDELFNALKKLLDLSPDSLRELGQYARAWAESTHSIPVTAKRLYETVYRHLLPSEEAERALR